jgi:hypothetical protein
MSLEDLKISIGFEYNYVKRKQLFKSNQQFETFDEDPTPIKLFLKKPSVAVRFPIQSTNLNESSAYGFR